MATGLAACNSGKELAKGSMEDNVSKIMNDKDAARRQYRTDALFMDAVNAKIQDDKENAFRIFSQLADLSPGNATVHYELSRLWLDRNNVDYSIKESKKALQLDSNNKWIQIQYADLLAYSGNFTEAASIYSKIALKERSPEDYLSRQAALLQKARKYDEALKVYDQLAVYVGEDDETLLLQKEQLFLNKNDVEGAAGEIRKLIRFYPNDPQYATLLAAVYENNNLKDKAASAIEDLCRRFPDDSDVQTTVLRYYLRNKDLKKVMQHLKAAVLNERLSAQERADMLLPFAQNRNLDPDIKAQTMEMIHLFAAQAPPQKEALLLLANVSAADGDLDGALMQYKRIIATDTVDFAPWQQVMYIYSVRSQHDSVMQYSKEATRLFPDEYLPYYFAGMSYAQIKQYLNATNAYRNALKHIPATDLPLQAEVLASLGDVYNTAGNFAASDSAYEAALRLQPDNATVLNNFSYYLSLRGEKLDKAERMSARSLRLRPDEANFLDTYGWIRYRQGKFAEARTYILKAIQQTPPGQDDASLWEHLGDIEYRAGDKEKALEYWKKAASGGPATEILQQKIREQKLND